MGANIIVVSIIPKIYIDLSSISAIDLVILMRVLDMIFLIRVYFAGNMTVFN